MSVDGADEENPMKVLRRGEMFPAMMALACFGVAMWRLAEGDIANMLIFIAVSAIWMATTKKGVINGH